jgi:hypothetical protein
MTPTTTVAALSPEDARIAFQAWLRVLAAKAEALRMAQGEQARKDAA